MLLISDGARDGGRTAPLAAARRAQAPTSQSRPCSSARRTASSRPSSSAATRSRSACRRAPARCSRSPRLSGGEFFRARTTAALTDVYKKLATRIGHKTQRPPDHRPLRRRRDRPAARRRRALGALVPEARAVRRALILARRGRAARAVAAAPAAATNECRGLQVCVPVVGPWVSPSPARSSSSSRARRATSSAASTPSSRAAGSTSASSARSAAPSTRGSRRARGRLPRTASSADEPRASFRPHIGCVPASGGGRRSPTAYHAFPPGKPTVRQVTTFRVRAGTTRASPLCRSAAPRLARRTPCLLRLRRRPRGGDGSVRVKQRVRRASSGSGARRAARCAAIVQLDLSARRDDVHPSTSAADAARDPARVVALPAGRRPPPHALRRPLHERRRARGRRRAGGRGGAGSRPVCSCSRSQRCVSPSRGRTCIGWSRATTRR